MINKETTIEHITEFILVKGDVSGIQEFIFNVRSLEAAKSIKGRSFFIKVLTEIVIQYLFDEFKVGDSDKENMRISTSGGNFIILLPTLDNLDNCEEKILFAQRLFSKSLRFSGLNIALNYVIYNKNNYISNHIELNEKIRKSKLKLYGALNNDDFKAIFEPQNKIVFDEIDKNEKWIGITESIRNYNSFSIEKKGQKVLKINIDSIELIGYTCLFYNNINVKTQNKTTDYLESIFPIKVGHIIDFEGLTKTNYGAEKLGILKMDVDNLGTTLENINDINEHKKFDYNLFYFFNVELRKIIENKFKNSIYTVTAGGDDSFFVGHWKTILELAQIIQYEFINYPYFKAKDLTISAGYVIVNPKFPVVRFSQLADEALHKAKYKYDKGNICLFDEVIPWIILKEIFSFKNLLNKGVDDKSKALLAKSRQSAIRGIDEETITLKENWEISYFLRDCNNKDVVNDIRYNIKKYISRSISYSTDSYGRMYKRAYRLIMPIAARILELEKR